MQRKIIVAWRIFNFLLISCWKNPHFLLGLSLWICKSNPGEPHQSLNFTWKCQILNMKSNCLAWKCNLINQTLTNDYLMIMRVKNHQMAPTIRVEAAFGLRPDPWRIKDLCYSFQTGSEDLLKNQSLSSTCLRKVPVINQKLLLMLNWFSITSFSTTLRNGDRIPSID